MHCVVCNEAKHVSFPECKKIVNVNKIVRLVLCPVC